MSSGGGIGFLGGRQRGLRGGIGKTEGMGREKREEGASLVWHMK